MGGVGGVGKPFNCLSLFSLRIFPPNYLKSSSLQMVVVLVETHLAQVQLFGTFHNGDERTDYFKYPQTMAERMCLVANNRNNNFSEFCILFRAISLNSDNFIFSEMHIIIFLVAEVK